MNPDNDPELRALTDALATALQEKKPDEAEHLLHRICAIAPEAAHIPVFPTLIAMHRGQTFDALRNLDAFPEASHPELRALCLRELGDPTWEGLAESLQDVPDPFVRQAMRQLLESAHP